MSTMMRKSHDANERVFSSIRFLRFVAFIIVIMSTARRWARGDHRGGGGCRGDELGCCGDACSGGRTTPGSNCYCRDEAKFGLKYNKQQFNNETAIVTQT